MNRPLLTTVLCSALTISGLAGCKARNFGSNVRSDLAAPGTNIPAGLDVNDVSWLFPAPTADADRDALFKFSDGATGNELFPKKPFDRLVKLSQDEGGLSLFRTGAANYGFWRVVAARFDICVDRTNRADMKSKNDLAAQKCGLQLRLVAQPFVAKGDPSSPGLVAEDQAIHLVYDIATDAVDSVAADLVKVRDASKTAGIETAYSPLGVHPALAKNFQSPVLGEMKNAIAKYARYEKLKAVATMFTTANATANSVRWNFFTAFVDHSDFNNAFKGFIPIVGGGNVQTLGGLFKPVTAQIHPTSRLAKFEQTFAGLITASGAPQTTKDLATALSVLDESDVANLRDVLDPSKTSIVKHGTNPPQLAMDCVSCHRATSDLLRLGSLREGLAQFPDDLSRANTGVPAGEFKLHAGKGFQAPAGVTSEAVLANLPNDMWDVRNFGHREIRGAILPAVSRFTLNDSALVADLFNRAVLGAPNPSPLKAGCEVDEMRRCVYFGGGAPCYVKHQCK